ncbi:hypothetical protein HanRHA438_Chr04g0186991 [Helianthus annuus]|nr:hypothetical protein HanHA300_Chr04g0145261 [Helianthus annuus]KAJ0597769.1 hypothetical protein HanHA89_Chr04g0158421 [Helianthus annuus]KAJ0758416.1 hypothetical protein HanLR1_Chr04g0150161 [Helianthus annuus]KAJ0762070.1 hypothetical protein HanOQP8_Chr04g0157291 [Helianthus annuus]KAJ0927799.1 hypothetical protein HanRHA438_Chr04g0186991 [Helianthus annuus]
MLFLLQHAPSSGLISQKLLSQFSLDLEIRIDGGGSVVVLYSDGRVYLDRYHCDVVDQRLAQHIHKGNEDGLLINSVAPCSNLWALIMDSCTGLDYATVGEILLYWRDSMCEQREFFG